MSLLAELTQRPSRPRSAGDSQAVLRDTTLGSTMKSIQKTKRVDSSVKPECRRLNFRSANELIARRKRLRQQVGAGLAILVGVGMLLIEF